MLFENLFRVFEICTCTKVISCYPSAHLTHLIMLSLVEDQEDLLYLPTLNQK